MERGGCTFNVVVGLLECAAFKYGGVCVPVFVCLFMAATVENHLEFVSWFVPGSAMLRRPF